MTRTVGSRIAAAVVGFGLCGTTVADGDEASAHGPVAIVVVTRPHVAVLQQSALVIVRGLDPARGLNVRLAGSTTAIGLLAPWLPLRFRDGAWTGRLPPLERRGVYQIELRGRVGSRILTSRRWLFRVLERGTLRRPTFTSPVGVARWWVRVRAHGTLVAVRQWPMSIRDQRDHRLHRKLVIAYSPPGDTSVAGRLGFFITCVRLDFGARWRLLDASVAP
jgi:hypothetical protein